MEPIEQQLDHARDLCQQGRIDEGKKIYLNIYATDPSSFRALANLGAIELNAKDYQASIRYFREAIELNSTHPIIYYNLGRALYELKMFEEAIVHYKTAIKLNANFSEAFLNLGVTLNDQKNYQSALDYYAQAIQLKPDYVEAYINRGVTLNALKDYQNALSDYQRAVQLDPNNAETYYNLGITLYHLGEFDQAIANYKKAIQINPDHAKAYSNRGLSFNQLGQYESALDDYLRALQLKYVSAEIYNNIGVTLNHLGRYEESLDYYNQSIQLEPDYAEAYTNRGLTLNDLKQYEAALSDYYKAIRLKPDYVPSYNNIGLTLYRLGRYNEALENYEKAISLAPEEASAYWNKSLMKLLMGEFEEGWELYERRWGKEGFEEKRHTNIPLWTGREDLEGKTLLIWSEQGQGDIIQFSRYALLVKDKGAQVTLEVPKSLVSLLSTIDQDINIFEEGKPHPPQFDLQIPLMSLPYAVGTTIETIPSKSPYIHADAQKISEWHKKLGIKNNFRVGLVWSGSALHKNDSNRSLPLKTLSEITELPIEFHSLQIQYRENDWIFLKELSRIIDHQSELKDFSDTAALIHNMDLIISVDTSVAHLAGAMGKKTWLILPYSPDFRWLLGRVDTPWYPSVKLFRQPQTNEWASVIANIKEELKNSIYR